MGSEFKHRDGVCCEEIHDSVIQVKLERPSSCTYIIKGNELNAIIDPGLGREFPKIKEHLDYLGLSVSDINIVFNTHEHFNHLGGNKFFPYSIIGAHRLSAIQVEEQEEYILLRNQGDEPVEVRPHLWLENRNRINLGGFTLDVIHTPGHTPGSICLYEPEKQLLFSGDTIFAEGGISESTISSGSMADYIESLSTLSSLKIRSILPGHGWASTDAERDLHIGLEKARSIEKHGPADTD